MAEVSTDEGESLDQLLNRLQEEHAQLEARLGELERHVSLTDDEQLERVRIKKLKLATKDRMAQVAAALRQQSS